MMFCTFMVSYLAVMSDNISDNDYKLSTLRILLSLFFIIAQVLFRQCIERYDRFASYSGCLMAILTTAYVTEVTCALSEYRLYEGFIPQISISFFYGSFSTANWRAPCITQGIMYFYAYIRITASHTEAPPELRISLINTMIFYCIGAYLSSQHLKREFLSKCKQEKLTKLFQSTCSTMPEGVSIIDEAEPRLCFTNPKFKEVFTLRFCSDSKDYNKTIYSIQNKIDREYEQIKQDFIISKELDKEKMNFEKFLDKWNVSISPLNAEQGGDEEEKDYDIFKPPHSLASSKSLVKERISLSDFLFHERRNALESPMKICETKISLEFSEMHRVSKIQLLNKEFIVKTCQLNLEENSRRTSTKFMHIFIDTTQIALLEQAKAQNKYQKIVIANVSHEFRTPLNAINMSVELLKSKISPEDQRLAKIASSSCSILTSLVGDLLDSAKIEAGVFEIQEDLFYPSELCKSVKEIFELQTQRRGVELIFEIDDFLQDIQIQTDMQRIKQVLLNLLSNAFKFTDRGFIKVKWGVYKPLQDEDFGNEDDLNPLSRSTSLNRKEECKFPEPEPLALHDMQSLDLSRINISSKYGFVSNNNDLSENIQKPSEYDSMRRVPNSHSILEQGNNKKDILKKERVMLYLSVQDTGIGIPVQDRAGLFKMFGKVSSNHNRNKLGTGLGLSICKKILEKLNGDIFLESEEGKGTTFFSVFECGI
ncbi:unnamed protein product [Moneuplotes crassus]|uniref:histidine kinase n=1 Tax=Euplotes crassus TaxID=5936 RepID=A0AAD1XVZ0_EUPCR|nr:unnamed protein product [Moneuplotes crassus]